MDKPEVQGAYLPQSQGERWNRESDTGRLTAEPSRSTTNVHPPVTYNMLPSTAPNAALWTNTTQGQTDPSSHRQPFRDGWVDKWTDEQMDGQMYR